jgi:hypothetical protein
MIIGDKSKFAIESDFTQAYELLGLRALGFFVIHLLGVRYGVHEKNATMLACSFDEVQRRILGRGSHVISCATEPDAGSLADAFYDACYGADDENKPYFGITQKELSRLIYSNHLYWAPDGDEAFDDGSCVLHFDVGDRVRLIAYKYSKTNDGYRHDPATLSDLWLDARVFYQTLETWRDKFEAQWKAAPKTPQNNSGNP